MTSMPSSKQLLGDLRGDAEAASRILAVGDGEIDGVLFLQFRQAFVNDGAARAGRRCLRRREFARVTILGR